LEFPEREAKKGSLPSLTIAFACFGDGLILLISALECNGNNREAIWGLFLKIFLKKTSFD